MQKPGTTPICVKDCPTATEDEKKNSLAEFAAKKAADGLITFTCSWTDELNPSITDRSSGKRVFGNISKKENKFVTEKSSDNNPSCHITISDGEASIDCSGRFDGGSDDSIVSTELVE